MDLKNKKMLIAAVAAVVVLLAGLALYASTGDRIGAKLGLSSSTASPKTGAGESEDATPGSKAAAEGGSAGTSEAGMTGGKGAAVKQDESGDKPVMVDTDGDGVEEKAISVKILWWNDTMANQPNNAEVVFGESKYKPRSGPSDSGSIGPCPIGKKLQLAVYPDGPSGDKLVFQFLLNDEMLGNSERDAIHVEVKDDAVRILGNPVIDFSQSKDR